MITEFVKFQLLENATEEQLILKSDNLVNNFQKKQDGYIASELVKDTKENVWIFIYHYESMEKIMRVGEKMRQTKEFGEFFSLIVPESISVTFNEQLRKWDS